MTIAAPHALHCAVASSSRGLTSLTGSFSANNLRQALRSASAMEIDLGRLPSSRTCRSNLTHASPIALQKRCFSGGRGTVIDVNASFATPHRSGVVPNFSNNVHKNDTHNRDSDSSSSLSSRSSAFDSTTEEADTTERDSRPSGIKSVQLITDPKRAAEIALDLMQEPAVAVDCEGVALSRFGRCCLVQVADGEGNVRINTVSGTLVFLFDAFVRNLIPALRPLLESSHPLKIMHDCREDNASLFAQFGIRVNNVYDTQLAFFREGTRLVRRVGEARGKESSDTGPVTDSRHGNVGPVADSDEQDHAEQGENQTRKADPHESNEVHNYLISLDRLLDKCGLSKNTRAAELKAELYQDPNFWFYRPITENAKEYAAQDVALLVKLYKRLSGEEVVTSDSVNNTPGDSSLLPRATAISRKIHVREVTQFTTSRYLAYGCMNGNISGGRGAGNTGSFVDSSAKRLTYLQRDSIVDALLTAVHRQKPSEDSFNLRKDSKGSDELDSKNIGDNGNSSNNGNSTSTGRIDSLHFKLNLGSNKMGLVSQPDAIDGFQDVGLTDIVKCRVTAWNPQETIYYLERAGLARDSRILNSGGVNGNENAGVARQTYFRRKHSFGY